jgi:predicted nucleic acid-binding protein
LAEAGQFHVYTSSITITEVHKGNNKSKSASEGESKTIDFFRNKYFKVVDVDRSIAESAHRLCRKNGLKPYDAVHLACAVRAGCDVLLTWDSDLLNITHDGITISKPQAIGQSVLDLAAQPEETPPLVTAVLPQPAGSDKPQPPAEKREGGMQANSAIDPKLESPAGGDAKPVSNVPPVEVGLPDEANATSQLEPSKTANKPPSVTGDAVIPPDATEGH